MPRLNAGRSRTLHAEFFTDERVMQVSIAARILFQGLWCIADREGRLEEPHPLTLKARFLPADNVDAGALLSELVTIRLVRRYQADGMALLFIPGFPKRQRPHPKEVKSTLPAPPESDKAVEGQPEVPCMEPRVQPEVQAKVVFPSGSSGISDSSGSSGSSVVPPAGAGHRRPKRETIPPSIVPPDTPPESWLAQDFWRWFQGKRQQVGLFPEPAPNTRALASWYSDALGALNGDVSALQEAVYGFGEHKHWQNAKPPLPFGAFMAEWSKFIPRRARAGP